jgi:hypothetical protein
MNQIGLGSEGKDVEKLQRMLNEIYQEQVDVDGIFGPHTEEMVVDFQWSSDLVADGIVGPATWKALEDYEAEDDESVEEEAPAPSGMIIYQSQLTSLYGSPRDPAPYLKILDFKEFKNDFSHVRDFEGNKWSCRIYGHQLMDAPLRNSFRLLIARGFAGEFRTYDGCLSIRQMTSGNGWSVHSWGLAIDINAGTNQYGRKPTISQGFVGCFTESNFNWGGLWTTPDGMHFQIPRIR